MWLAGRVSAESGAGRRINRLAQEDACVDQAR